MIINNVGYHYRHPTEFYIDRPNGSGDYLLLLLKTEAFFVLEGKRIISPAGSALLFKKGTPQLYGATGEEFVNDWIHFDSETVDEAAFSALGIPFDTILLPSDAATLSELVKNIFWERHSQNQHKAASAGHYLALLLLKLSEGITAQAARCEHPYYHTFCALRNEIRLAPQNDWSIDAISKKMCLSRSYVQHLYKDFFGRSILLDVQSFRIEHAKYLLSATKQTVASISLACGYESDVHFMRMFKRETDMTPTAFRNKMRNLPGA